MLQHGWADQHGHTGLTQETHAGLENTNTETIKCPSVPSIQGPYGKTTTVSLISDMREIGNISQNIIMMKMALIHGHKEAFELN